MATSNGGFLHTDPPATSAPTIIPPWLTTTVRPSPSPSVTLTLSPLTGPQIPWLQSTDRASSSSDNPPHLFTGMVPENPLIHELAECCRELEEGQRAWAGHRKESTWRLKRVELQLESEKTCRKREKIEEIETKIKALYKEQRVVLDRIETEYREQLAGLRREAEIKEQKLAEQWAAKHNRLSKFLEQMGCRSIAAETNGR